MKAKKGYSRLIAAIVVIILVIPEIYALDKCATALGWVMVFSIFTAAQIVSAMLITAKNENNSMGS